MHYVQMTRKEEKDRAEKLDKLVNIEVEKQYERRDIKKGKEKEARASLLQDVLQTRREQIRERGTCSSMTLWNKVQNDRCQQISLASFRIRKIS